MHKKLKLLLFIIGAILYITTNNAFAQKCDKKKLATKEMRLDYDYRGQSFFQEVISGDTIMLSITLYSKQNYRIFVVGEQKLGKVDYEIFVPRKKFSRIVDSVKPKTIVVYKRDPGGFFLYNIDGERIPIGEEVVMDTVWDRATTVTDERVYDSKRNSNFFWEAKPAQTQSITIKVKVEDAIKPTKGCIGIYVGREYSNIYQFRR